MLSLTELQTEIEIARSKPPSIIGSCDYIIDELFSQLQSNANISCENMSRYIVSVKDQSNRMYTDGHILGKIQSPSVLPTYETDVVYIDASLDQFCDSNKSFFNISLGDKQTINSVIIMNEYMYDILHNVDRSEIYDSLSPRS